MAIRLLWIYLNQSDDPHVSVQARVCLVGVSIRYNLQKDGLQKDIFPDLVQKGVFFFYNNARLMLIIVIVSELDLFRLD